MWRIPLTRRLSWMLLLPLLPLIGCEEEVYVYEIKAQVKLAVPEEEQVQPMCTGYATDCRLDFGEAPLAAWTERTVLVSNPVNLPLEIAEFRMSSDSDPAFAVEATPMLLEAGITKEIRVKVRPTVGETQIEGTLLLFSNATNGAVSETKCSYPDFLFRGAEEDRPVGDPTDCTIVEVKLVATGVDRGVPHMQIIPIPGTPATPEVNAVCEFGAVGVGDTSVCRVQIRNVGERVLTLDGIEMSPDNPATRPDAESDPVPVFSIGGSATADSLIIEAGAAANLVVTFAPPGLHAYEGTLRLQTNDPSYPDGAAIELRGVGHQAPVAECSIYAVNGNLEFDPEEDIEPLSDVQLTGETSYTDVQGAEVASYHWSIVSAPDGSTAVLTDPNGERPAFVFESSGREQPGLDLAGPYTVQLIVKDSFNVRSQPCFVEFEAIPQDALAIQLIWDHPTSDVDIHLLRTGDSSVYRDNGLDCYYRNCRNPGLDWGASLDIDDVNGYGPENISIDEPRLGDYVAGVNYYRATPTTGGVRETIATVRVHLYGLLSCEVEAVLEDTGAWWESVIITTEKGGVCATDDECRRGQSCVTDETALICESDIECPADYLCTEGTCAQSVCRGSRLVCQPTNRPVDPIPPTGG